MARRNEEGRRTINCHRHGSTIMWAHCDVLDIFQTCNQKQRTCMWLQWPECMCLCNHVNRQWHTNSTYIGGCCTTYSDAILPERLKRDITIVFLLLLLCIYVFRLDVLSERGSLRAVVLVFIIFFCGCAFWRNRSNIRFIFFFLVWSESCLKWSMKGFDLLRMKWTQTKYVQFENEKLWMDRASNGTTRPWAWVRWRWMVQISCLLIL